MRRAAWLALGLAACGDVKGFAGGASAIARLDVYVGAAPDAGHPRVALVWGAQWLPELFCVLPPESYAAGRVIAAGCPDSFGFVPRRVAASVAVTPGTPATLELFNLPSAEVMIGDVTARVVYGSLVVFDDRNESGTLELRRSFAAGGDEPDAGPGDMTPPEPAGPDDVVLGASFVSMTQPDLRLAFREGEFDARAAYYPREGCDPPPKGFSLLVASGFSEAEAYAALLQGKLPREAQCGTRPLQPGPVTLGVADGVAQIACLPRRTSGVTRYREPPNDDGYDLNKRVWACAGLPSLPGEPSDPSIQQLVVAGPFDDPCKTLFHYVLRGCDNDPTCATPEWDRTATPPPWWPCK